MCDRAQARKRGYTGWDTKSAKPFRARRMSPPYNTDMNFNLRDYQSLSICWGDLLVC